MVLRLLSILLLGSFVATTSLAPASGADPYDVNVLMSLTGTGAFLGQIESQTLKAIEEMVNRKGGIDHRPLRFVIRDDQSNPQVAVQLANALIGAHVPVILGPNYSASCGAVLPLVKDGPVQFCFSPSVHPPAGSYTFSVSVSTKDLAMAGIRYLRDRGFKRLALLMTTDATGQDGENVIRQDLAYRENRDVSIVAAEHFNVNDLTISAQIERIKAADAQAIITWVVGPPFGTVLRGVNEGGLQLPVLTDAGNINNVQMQQYVTFLPKELYFTGFRFLGHSTIGPGPIRDVQNQFLTALHQHGVAEPDPTYTFSWDAAMVVVDALRHLGTNATAQQLHDYIEQLHGFPGIDGLLDFRDGSQTGLTPMAALIVRWEPPTKAWIPVSGAGGYPLKPAAR
jgi:branched-chain amino acid transport system substrate-binding protein